MQFRLFLYQQEILKKETLPCPVISIGNITTGGTGKTPTVITVADMLRKQGKRVVILSRGYRRNTEEANVIVLPDSDVRSAGDEPLLIAQKLHAVNEMNLPDIPVIVGSKRAISGRMAMRRFQPDVMLLDDGFQHVQLARTFDIVLIDATNPFGGGSMLPAGFLREPLVNLARADAFIITRSDEVEDVTFIEQQLRKYNRNAPIFRGVHAFERIAEVKTVHNSGFQETADDSPHPLFPEIRCSDKRLLAVSGLANPQSFLRLLDSIGLPIVEHLDFPDHHWYTQQDAETISQLITQYGIEAIITTEKDQTKLSNVCSFDIPVYAVGIRMNIHPKPQFIHSLLAQCLISH